MTLDLTGNKVGDAGAAAIADALRVNGVLMTLCLTGKKVGDAGAAARAAAIANALERAS